MDGNKLTGGLPMELGISLGGILCLYLGYRIFVIGTNQPFKIFSNLQGWKLKAATISPAIFLAILGSLILCSPVITNIISIFQNERFINAYATKLILDELREKDKLVLSDTINDDARTTKNPNEDYPEKSHFVPQALNDSGKAIVTSEVLRLRRKPGVQHQIIGSLQKGHVIVIKEERGLWLRVTTGAYGDGWVHGQYVRRLDGPSPDVS